jgi:hypothetical protein
MYYNVDRIPIKLTNEKRAVSARSTLLIMNSILLLLMMAIGSLAAFVWHEDTRLPVALMTLLTIVGIFNLLQKSTAHISSIVIDERGLHVVKNDLVREYLWTDISGAKITSDRFVDDLGKTRCVDYIEIRRKGELVHDPKVFCPREDFGIGPNDLESIIHDGMKRWGSLSPEL